MRKKIVYTSGDPAGIGIDLLFKLKMDKRDFDLIVLADPKHILSRAKECNIKIDIIIVDDYQITATNLPQSDHPESIYVYPILDSLVDSVIAGKANAHSSPYILAMLEKAVQWCHNGIVDAMVTGPINKALINNYGIPFSGHTELLAEQTNTPQTVMMLKNDTVSVCLATTHIPLKSVADNITSARLESLISIINKSLQKQFNIANPCIAVLGLNPHAGENGHIGLEDKEIIEPLIQKLNQENYHIIGPLSADTAFCEPMINQADTYLAMYHDQGLPIVKYTGFGQTVNVTLGLPIIRTSVDHGTAYSLSGSNNADAGSLHKAIELAHYLANNQQP